MADLGWFAVGITLGLAGGLVCRRNNIQILPKYYDADLGIIGKKHYEEARFQVLVQRELDA